MLNFLSCFALGLYWMSFCRIGQRNSISRSLEIVVQYDDLKNMRRGQRLVRRGVQPTDVAATVWTSNYSAEGSYNSEGLFAPSGKGLSRRSSSGAGEGWWDLRTQCARPPGGIIGEILSHRLKKSLIFTSSFLEDVSILSGYTPVRNPFMPCTKASSSRKCFFCTPTPGSARSVPL